MLHRLWGILTYLNPLNVIQSALIGMTVSIRPNLSFCREVKY